MVEVGVVVHVPSTQRAADQALVEPMLCSSLSAMRVWSSGVLWPCGALL